VDLTVRSFRDRDLLGAVYVVPDVELDVVPEGIPDPDWQRRFIETVRRSPSDAEDLVPDELQPALLVRSLADLLTETPIVNSADRSVIHLDGPEREAVLFLHTYIIDGERWVVGYDYRPR
jgi:hypothetical protein